MVGQANDNITGFETGPLARAAGIDAFNQTAPGRRLVMAGIQIIDYPQAQVRLKISGRPGFDGGGLRGAVRRRGPPGRPRFKVFPGLGQVAGGDGEAQAPAVAQEEIGKRSDQPNHFAV